MRNGMTAERRPIARSQNFTAVLAKFHHAAYNSFRGKRARLRRGPHRVPDVNFN